MDNAALPTAPLSAHDRAKGTVIALGIFAALTIFAILATFNEISLVGRLAGEGDVTEGEAAVNLASQGFIGMLRFFAYLVCAIMFCMWIHRAYRVLVANRVPGLKHTPGWAVGWYFVPVANLYKPYYVMQEIYEQSIVRRQDSMIAAAPATGVNWLLVAWWMTWITAGFVGMYASIAVSLAGSTEAYVLARYLGALSLAIEGVSAVLLIRIIRQIDRRQATSFAVVPQPPTPVLTPTA